VEALEEEKEMWKDRSESMGEMLRNIEADADEREKEHQKLLFLIGMREGELARLHRQVDHMNEIRHLEGRDMYETRPGDLARPSSPYFNEIDEQAKVSVPCHLARQWIDTRVAGPIFASRRVCARRSQRGVLTIFVTTGLSRFSNLNLLWAFRAELEPGAAGGRQGPPREGFSERQDAQHCLCGVQG
jgi:hypothetical protein